MNIIKRFMFWVLQGLIGLSIIVFFAFLLSEWAVGCGESYVDAKGKTHINECLFIKPSK